MIENICVATPDWNPYFLRTSNGAEIDLILENGRKKIAVEIKASSSPTVGKGFWNLLAETEIDEAWVIAPVKEEYPLGKNTMVAPLDRFISHLSNL